MATTNLKVSPDFVTIGAFSYAADESGFIKVNNRGVRNPQDRMIDLIRHDRDLRVYARYGWIDWIGSILSAPFRKS